MDLIVENVRCFAGRHVAPLAPLTILVGENSSGKSTLVALARLAWDAMDKGDAVDFNEDPFRLGAFEDIVTTTPAERFNMFRIGFRFPARTADNRRVSGALTEDIEVQMTFAGKDAQPGITEWSIRSASYSLNHVVPISDSIRPVLEVRAGPESIRVPMSEFPTTQSPLKVCRYWRFWQKHARLSEEVLEGRREHKGATRLSKDADRVIESLTATVDAAFRGRQRPYATAPIRTRPRRTYDPITDKPTPEGEHVPMYLAKRAAASKSDPQWKLLMESLCKFGTAAGLFSALDVKRMGGSEANLPFQLRVEMGVGTDFNLIDVGYGVSQVLPVIVDSITNRESMLLLQQPEVHLHPRAQAELGSFLGRLASGRTSIPIIVETHSDFLVDRVRMDIRDKKGIRPEDVSLLFLNRKGGVASINRLWLDEYGNLVDAPADYRAFFLAEERRFLQG